MQELLAFDAVARHESLTRAASSLCITVSGVSKQISGLETFVGRRLLQKTGRGVRLTGTGWNYWERISPCLRTIESATFEARSGEAGIGTITLASAPTFLTKWLIPKLPDFGRKHPDVMFSFSQHLAPNDPHPPNIDAAIRYGKGEWPGVMSDYIAGREFVCIYGAKMAAQLGHELTPEDVPKLTLLHHEETPSLWQRWVAHWHLMEGGALPGPRFAQYSAIVQAVRSGLGVGLVPQIIVEDELADGSVLSLHPALDLDIGHYLCFRPDRLERPIFVAFHDWILGRGGRASV
ncbi:hypothetical protein DFQ28_008822 [Apophysomyces sp. BC1034]|nr:hypothetical protein DFQ28_008822 [Apophysomyces sp. BC1034]